MLVRAITALRFKELPSTLREPRGHGALVPRATSRATSAAEAVVVWGEVRCTCAVVRCGVTWKQFIGWWFGTFCPYIGNNHPN